MSRVDVIVPCYNYGRYLRTCVQSILFQEGVDVRLLIIDDASSDESAQVAATLAAEDSRITFHKHLVNKGHIATYNEGVDWASGDYLLLISADDFLVSGALQRATNLLDEHDHIVLTYGQQLHFDDESCLPPVDTNLINSPSHIVSGDAFLLECCSQAQNPVSTPTVVVRTSVQKTIGGYRAQLPHTADLELWLRFATRGSIGIIHAIQAYKRRHQTNMQLDYLQSEVGDIIERQAAFDAFFHEDSNLIPQSNRLREVVYSSLATELFWYASEAFSRRSRQDYRLLLDMVLKLDPTFSKRLEWHKFQIKQLLGPSCWNMLRHLMQLRHYRSRISHNLQARAPESL